MVTRLASILRYSLQKDRQDTVPLSSEVEAVSDYLALESVRYDDRLRIHLEVADEAAHSQIPPTLLQTSSRTRSNTASRNTCLAASSSFALAWTEASCESKWKTRAL
jgi:hypothetical protein